MISQLSQLWLRYLLSNPSAESHTQTPPPTLTSDGKGEVYEAAPCKSTPPR